MQVRPENDHEQSRSSGATTRRLEALSDGVFAIAIKLPANGAVAARQGSYA
jgi:hypothetical protein